MLGDGRGQDQGLGNNHRSLENEDPVPDFVQKRCLSPPSKT